MKDKQISFVHLIYTLILSVTVITFIVILFFGGGSDAGNQMNVAATAVSIILAVIAILMTLVDVAGQRQSMIDLKETADSLKKSNEVAQEMIKNSVETVRNFEEMQTTLYTAVESFRNETISALEKIQGKGDLKELKPLIEKLQNQDKYIQKFTANNIVNTSNEKLKVGDVLKIYNEIGFEKGEELSYKIFNSFIENFFGSKRKDVIFYVLKANDYIAETDRGTVKILK